MRKNFWLCFEEKNLTELLKKNLIDNDYKTVCGAVRSECSSCRVRNFRIVKCKLFSFIRQEAHHQCRLSMLVTITKEINWLREMTQV